MKNIKKITVIGLGLIGGSLALSLKNTGEDFIITGYDIEGEAMNIAKYRNIIDVVAITSQIKVVEYLTFPA